jgi:hypothetical protein
MYVYYIGKLKLCESTTKVKFTEHFPAVREVVEDDGAKGSKKKKDADTFVSVDMHKEDK